MTQARDVRKAVPEELYLVWVGGEATLDNKPAPEGSYRIHWSLIHATNWFNKAIKAGRKSKIFKYDGKTVIMENNE